MCVPFTGKEVIENFFGNVFNYFQKIFRHILFENLLNSYLQNQDFVLIYS